MVLIAFGRGRRLVHSGFRARVACQVSESDELGTEERWFAPASDDDHLALMRHGGDDRVVGFPARMPPRTEDDAMQGVVGPKTANDLGIQGRSGRSGESDSRNSFHVHQQSPLCAKHQGSCSDQDVAGPRGLGSHPSVQLHVEIDASAARIVPHPLNLDIRQPVTGSHQRLDSLQGWEVENQLVNFGVPVLLDDLDQADVSADRTQRTGECSERSGLVR